MDFAGDAAAIAARFASGILAPPAGYAAIREATATPPQALGMLPALVVFLDDGELITAHGERAGGIDYLARFYYVQTADIPREGAALLAWASVLVDALKGSVQLGGRVARATVDGFTVGLLPYADLPHAGIELRVHVTTSEAWGATA